MRCDVIAGLGRRVPSAPSLPVRSVVRSWLVRSSGPCEVRGRVTGRTEAAGRLRSAVRIDTCRRCCAGSSVAGRSRGDEHDTGDDARDGAG